jgi:23S rRNA pseudouridine2604 synthase
MRVNKYISETGVCSRREADALVAQGRVTINGAVAELGSKVEPGDEVRLDGELIGAKKRQVLIALNKPIGITCTTERHIDGNIIDFIGYPERIFPIGRLDKDSEGLILLTNNGDLVNPILRVENHHEKEYLVTVERTISDADLAALSRGVRILGTTTRRCKVQRQSSHGFRIVLTQGMNRQIRRMCAALDYRVRHLQRIRIMNIRLGELELGHWRNLTPAEVRELTTRIGA